MKHFRQFLAVLLLLMLVGCATSGGSGGSSSSGSSSSGKQLSADDYKRLGIQETGNTVR